MPLDHLLEQAVARGVSDNHLTPDNPAMIRMDTRLTLLPDAILDSADTEI